MALKYKKEVSAGAIILNSENRILLLFQKANQFWDLPKGQQEKGEELKGTLKRELKEETGIEKFEKIPDFEYQLKYKFSVPEGFLIDKIVHVYLLRTFDQVKLSSEHTDFKWSSLEEARDLVKHKNQKELLDFLEKFVKEKGIELA